MGASTSATDMSEQWFEYGFAMLFLLGFALLLFLIFYFSTVLARFGRFCKRRWARIRAKYGRNQGNVLPLTDGDTKTHRQWFAWKKAATTPPAPLKKAHPPSSGDKKTLRRWFSRKKAATTPPAPLDTVVSLPPPSPAAWFSWKQALTTPPPAPSSPSSPKSCLKSGKRAGIGLRVSFEGDIEEFVLTASDFRRVPACPAPARIS